MKAWWSQRTLRFRLAAWYGLVGSLLLAGFGATLYFFVTQRMARPLDHQLRQDLRIIEQKLTVRPDHEILWSGHTVGERAAWTTQYPWFELWDEQGQLVRRFWPFTENRVQQLPVAPARGRETISVFSVAPDLRLRVLSVPYSIPGQDAQWMLRIMRIHEPVTDALSALRLIILASLPVVIALLVLTGYLATRRWLMPLDHMATEAHQITVHDLSRRLPVENPHDELGRLGSVFNTTLDRLESSFIALDRFVADASHELRTPLTTLRSVGEVGLRRGRTADEYREIIGSMLEEAQRLQLLTGRLLDLARAEGGAPEIHRAELQLDEHVVACVHDLSILAEARRQRLVCEDFPCRVETDPVLFRQALQNLIDNAIKYSPEGSLIRVVMENHDKTVSVAVMDAGPGIPAESRAHLTERFYRPDPGRGRASGGFGLGLSLTKAYLRLLDGSLEYGPAPGGGSVFRLNLAKG